MSPEEQKHGLSRFRSAITVANYEVLDALRSRRVWILLILFTAGAIAGLAIFLRVLHSMEQQMAVALNIPAAQTTGGAASTLWKSNMFREMLIHLLDGNRELAESLLSYQILSLFFAWMAFTFGPLLAVLTSGARVTEEIWSGSARFVLFRIPRGSWYAGKFAGQAAVFLMALLAGAAGAWAFGCWKMAGMDKPMALAEMLTFACKAWVYGLAYLGLANGVALFSRSPILATVLGIISMIVVSAGQKIAEYYSGDGWRSLLDLVARLTPSAHFIDWLRPDLPHAVPAGIFLLCLAVAYSWCGYAVLARKDL
jgi:ABC-type transport system involved in multi-copper enzyme maturation permease subunit